MIGSVFFPHILSLGKTISMADGQHQESQRSMSIDVKRHTKYLSMNVFMLFVSMLQCPYIFARDFMKISVGSCGHISEKHSRNSSLSGCGR
jgi:hypothetical protein